MLQADRGQSARASCIHQRRRVPFLPRNNGNRYPRGRGVDWRRSVPVVQQSCKSQSAEDAFFTGLYRKRQRTLHVCVPLLQRAGRNKRRFRQRLFLFRQRRALRQNRRRCDRFVSRARQQFRSGRRGYHPRNVDKGVGRSVQGEYGASQSGLRQRYGKRRIRRRSFLQLQKPDRGGSPRRYRADRQVYVLSMQFFDGNYNSQHRQGDGTASVLLLLATEQGHIRRGQRQQRSDSYRRRLRLAVRNVILSRI